VASLQDPRGLDLPKRQTVLARRLSSQPIELACALVWAALRRHGRTAFALALQWQRLGLLSAALRWWLDLKLSLAPSWRRLWLWFIRVLAFLRLDRPRLVGQRHKCLLPRNARGSTSHTYTAPRWSDLGLDHITVGNDLRCI